MDGMRIVADRDVGAAMCSLAAPQLFDQDREEGLVIVLDIHELSGEAAAAAREAVTICPAGALRLASR
jgi:ferredoxin